MSYVTNIGERVRRLRMIRGMSQAELSKACKLSPGHISEIENGIRKNIQARTVKKLAQGLNVNIAKLLGEEDWEIEVADSNDRRSQRAGKARDNTGNRATGRAEAEDCAAYSSPGENWIARLFGRKEA